MSAYICTGINCVTPKRFKHEKRVLFTALSVLVTVGAFTQSEGLAGINEATSLMTCLFDLATKPCYTIGTVLGQIVGRGRLGNELPDTKL